MCLSKRFKIPRFTLKPKKVYKVVVKFPWAGPKSYKTPFMYNIIQVGKSYKGKGIFNYLISFFPNQNIIEEGYIHCFSDISGLKEYFKEYVTAFDNSKYVIVECVIPAYTIYWEGKECFTLAARRLKYIKVIS